MRRGARAALPYGVAAFAFGASFGVLSLEAGFGFVEATAMSSLVWSGSAQFAAVSLVAAGGGAAAAIISAAFLNLRYAAMAIALAPSLPRRRAVRAGYGIAIADESWALALRENGRFERTALAGAAAVLYVTWVAGTAVGAAIGSVVADPGRLGLDAAFSALFLGLLWPHLRDRRGASVAAAGAAITLLLTPLLPVGLAVVLAVVAVAAGMRPP